VVVVLLAALAAPLAGCGDDPDALVLDVTADEDATRLRVEVKGPLKQPPVPYEFDVDPAGTGRDISDPEQAYQLALRFGAGGHYGVHIVDISGGAPSQSWAGEFDVSGVVHGDAHLTKFGPGDDSDGDGWPEVCPGGATECLMRDCNDGDAGTNPFAVDVCEDGVDQDCSGSDRTCEDADGDGYDETEDCNDDDAQVNPGVHESSTTCDGPEPRCDNGKDDDCDGEQAECHIDMDCDGHYPPSDGGDDCDDADPARYPGAIDVCDDGIDQDCDGTADDGCERCDEDGDGEYGYHPERGCDVAPDQRDCDDSDRAINHTSTTACGGLEGAAACALRGWCARPGVDEDCDGQVNEGCPAQACDQDGDGFAVASCPTPPPAGMADCNDADAHVYPGAPDVCGDTVLQNCSIDLPCSQDADGDGYNAGADCNDADNTVHPWASEACNARDDDCDGVVDDGNPGVSAGTTLDGAQCNFDNDGVCATGPGRCVCSPTLSDGMMDPTGDRTLCPGESAGQPWGPRCFGATQPGYEQCDALDHDCNEIPDAPGGENLDPAILGSPCHNLPAPCVQGVVIGCDLSMSHPWYTNPSYVCSSDERGPMTETCNGVNDDCDGQTDEGFNLGLPCDGGDGDLCLEGQIACDGMGGAVCNDGTGTNAELCDFVDNNCNGVNNEGFVTGTPCDGPDADLCNEGAMVCAVGGMSTVCSDVSGDNIELCNNGDDDCDGQTDEGFPQKGQACDGGDTDMCIEGVFVCNGPGTGVTCNDNTGNTVELCDATDNDCDGTNNEGFALGVPCDGSDSDMCIEGVTVCAGNGMGTVCSDNTSGTTETCNNVDDDCDMTVDDGAGATCGPLGDTCTSGACGCGAGGLCSTDVADNCASGVCRCGSGAACNPVNSDACTSGNCRCGGGQACTGLSDTCTSGSCRCGMSAGPCSSAVADACVGGTCMCGGGAACDPQRSNNCTGGMCRCEGNPACSGLSDTCSMGQCKCGANPACDPAAADSCVGGLCRCGNGDACSGMQSCIMGQCQ
jgi:hypothetical protein